MNPLELQKQLLIAESELNRAQLAQEWQMMRGEVRALTDQARTLRSIVSAATWLIGTLTVCRHRKPAPVKPSWLQLLLKGAAMAAVLWRSRAIQPATNPCRENDQ